MGLLLQGGSANIADVQFEGGAGNKTVVIPKEGGKLAVGTMLSGVTAYHLLQGDLSVSNEVITNGAGVYTYTGNTTVLPTVSLGMDIESQWGNDATEKYGYLIIIKSRSASGVWSYVNSIRGRTKYTDSSTTGVEGTDANMFTLITVGGNTTVNIGTSTRTNVNGVTYSMEVYQTTHIKTYTTNHNKTAIEHYNMFTGFTIENYEGSGLAGHDLLHSLGRKLGFRTTKNLSAVTDWFTYLEDGRFGRLNTAEAFSSSAEFSTDTVVNIGTSSVVYNASTNQYIMFGWTNSYFDDSGKLIGIFEIGVYQGTGLVGNKVTTRNKMARLEIKRIDSTADWCIFDNQRGSDFDNYLLPNGSNIEQIGEHFDVVIDGFINTGTLASWNTSGGQYLYFGFYDNDSGSGKSKYPRATDTSNIQVNNAIIPFANGVDSSGTKVSTISKNESITGLTYTAGKNYVYALENGTYGVKPYRPRYLRSDLVAEKAGDNPDYFDVLSNTWYSTINPELVTNGTFTSGTTGWTGIVSIAGLSSSTISVDNGTLKILNATGVYGASQTSISTVIGKKYKLSLNIANGSGTLTSWILKVGTTSTADGNIHSYSTATFGSYMVEFIAQSTTTYITVANSNQSGGYSSVDNVTCYKTDLELDAPITARNYLDTIAYADASGKLTYVEELPKTQYFDRIETGSNRKVMYLADYGIAQIQNNKRYVLDNPFGNYSFMDCDVKVEILTNNKWYEPKWDGATGSTATAYGVTIGSMIEGICIQTGISGIKASSNLTGALDGENVNYTSAPARVIIQFNGKTGRTR